MKGYVYVLSNPSMPGLVKIGRSIHGGNKRARDIFQTGVPEPFRLEFELLCDDHEAVEQAVHSELGLYRPWIDREFFRVDIAMAMVSIINAALEPHDYRAAHCYEYSAIDQMGRFAAEFGVPTYKMCLATKHLSSFAARHALNKHQEFIADVIRKNKERSNG